MMGFIKIVLYLVVFNAFFTVYFSNAFETSNELPSQNVCYDENHQNESNEVIKNQIECDLINVELKNCTCTTNYVDCSNRDFQSIPEDLSKLPISINRLFFKNNSINYLNSINLSNETSIKVIDLRRNKIKSVQDFFSNQLAESLEYLNMCGNLDLNEFNLVKSNFEKLNHLEINHSNKPLKISDNFFNKEKFPNLIFLSLNDANLEFEEHPFDRLDKLEILRLDSNKLDKLPCDSLMEMLSLTSLNLNNNLLSKQADVTKDCLKSSMDLRELHLKSNDFAFENLEWMNLAQFKKLEKLDLSENRFKSIPYETLDGLKSLTSLKISIDENVFTKPASKETVLPNLTYLDLTNSNINKLQNRSFEMISTEITELILKKCQLKEIDADAFGSLTNLIFLDLSNNKLKTLKKPSSLSVFDYDSLRGNVDLKNNIFNCDKNIEWFRSFYDYKFFDRYTTCYLINGTRIPIKIYINSNMSQPIIPVKTRKFNILAIILLVLIVLVIAMGITYVIKRKKMKQRQQQYRYRYFTERSQDDGFDTDNVPVYRDCTVSLRIKDTEDNNNIINVNADGSAVLSEQDENKG